MSEDLSGISYSVDISTEGLLSAGKFIEKSVDSVSKSLSGLSAPLKKVSTGVRKGLDDMAKSFKPLTAAAETSVKEVADSLSQLRSEYNNSENALKMFIATQLQSGKSINSTGQVMDAAGNEVKELTQELMGLRTAYTGVTQKVNTASSVFRDLTPAMDRVNNSANLGKTGMADLGKRAGMAGIQMQQFIGQIQGGQGVMLALSQQSTDLAWVLGFPLTGAIVGIGASIIGMMMPALMNGKDSTDLLTEALKKLDETTEKTSTGIVDISDELNTLAKTNMTLATAKAELGIARAKDVVKASIKVISDELSGLKNLSSKTFTELGDLVQEGVNFDIRGSGLSGLDKIPAIQKFGEQFGLAGEEARIFAVDILSLYETLEKDPSAAGVESFTQSISKLRADFKDLDEDGRALIENIISAGSEAIRAGKSMDVLAENIKNGFSGKEISESKEFAKQLAHELEVAKLRAGDLNVEAALLEARFKLGLTEAEKLPDGIENSIRAMITLTEEQKKSNDEAKQVADAISSYEKFEATLKSSIAEMQNSDQAFEDYIAQQRAAAEAAGENADEIERLIRLNKELAEESRAQDEIDAIMQEVALLEMKRDLTSEQYEIEAALMALGEGADQTQVDALTAQIEKMQQLRFEAQLTGQTIQESFKKTGLSAMNDFSKAMAGAIVQGESLDDALKGVARTMITEMLAAVIRYWAGQAAAALLGTATASGAAAAATAVTVAAATAATAAWTVPATLASIATFGGAAAAGVAAMGAGLAAGAGAVAAASAVTTGVGAAVGGGRLYGGAVNAGMLYPVTENGKPEVLTQGSKQYLLPGANGKVTSNRDMVNSNDNSNFSVTMPISIYGNTDAQDIRNALFDQEDLLFDLYERAKAKRGIR